MITDRSMILQAVQKSQHALVITHVDPDGDAIGSLTAVGQALKQIGLNVTLVCDDAVPARFHYLPLSDTIVQTPERHTHYDLLVAVDCGDETRMGEAFESLILPRPYIINIDHHVTNNCFGDLNLIDGEATSTVEILFHLFVDWNLDITKPLATSLLTGLVTDTLGFRTSGVTADTMKVAGALIEAGANLGMISMQALNLRAYSTIRMWQTGFANMRLEEGLLWTTISNEERQTLGFRGSSSQGLVNIFADVEEAAIGAVLMEMEDESIRVGLRCRPPFDVAAIALELGGGGHKLAAGCTMEGPLLNAEKLLVTLCKTAIAQKTSTEHA